MADSAASADQERAQHAVLFVRHTFLEWKDCTEECPAAGRAGRRAFSTCPDLGRSEDRAMSGIVYERSVAWYYPPLLLDPEPEAEASPGVSAATTPRAWVPSGFGLAGDAAAAADFTPDKVEARAAPTPAGARRNRWSRGSPPRQASSVKDAWPLPSAASSQHRSAPATPSAPADGWPSPSAAASDAAGGSASRSDARERLQPSERTAGERGDEPARRRKDRRGRKRRTADRSEEAAAASDCESPGDADERDEAVEEACDRESASRAEERDAEAATWQSGRPKHRGGRPSPREESGDERWRRVREASENDRGGRRSAKVAAKSAADASRASAASSSRAAPPAASVRGDAAGCSGGRRRGRGGGRRAEEAREEQDKWSPADEVDEADEDRWWESVPKGALTCQLHLSSDLLVEGFRGTKRIIGVGGENTGGIYNATGAKIRLRGEGSGHIEASTKSEAREPLMLAVNGEPGQAWYFAQAVSQCIDLLRSVERDLRSHFAKTSGDERLKHGSLFWIGHASPSAKVALARVARKHGLALPDEGRGDPAGRGAHHRRGGRR